MQILAIDIGTGTQDVLLFDSERAIENCPKLVMPSPTSIVAGRVRQATRDQKPLGLIGTNMGGGPSSWAIRAHIQAGLPVMATPTAARTIDDDLRVVEEMGVRLAGEDEIRSLAGAKVIPLEDFSWQPVRDAFSAFDINLEPDAVAIAVLDHGDAPPGTSDRRFRFCFLSAAVAREPSLYAFANLASDIPPQMTRMQAVAASVGDQQPVMVMDTPAAAVLGGLDDYTVGRYSNLVMANLGNSHTLAFHLLDGRIAGLFEHHTGAMTVATLDDMLDGLANRTLTNEAVFDGGGHGAIILEDIITPPPEIFVVTGPRRTILQSSRLPVHFAVPHGDMMLAGCFGLLRALAIKMPALAPAIENSLGFKSKRRS
jgi:uncharacterized protein (DUF1786 family)